MKAGRGPSNGRAGTNLADVDNLAALDLPERDPPQPARPALAKPVEALALGALLEPVVVRHAAGVVVLGEKPLGRSLLEGAVLIEREGDALLARKVLAVLRVILRDEGRGLEPALRLRRWRLRTDLADVNQDLAVKRALGDAHLLTDLRGGASAVSVSCV